MIEIRKLNDVEPCAYLTCVVARIVHGHPVNRLAELLPWAWNSQVLTDVQAMGGYFAIRSSS